MKLEGTIVAGIMNGRLGRGTRGEGDEVTTEFSNVESLLSQQTDFRPLCLRVYPPTRAPRTVVPPGPHVQRATST